MVHRHQDKAALARQALAIIGRQLLARPGGEPAAVQPDHHRPPHAVGIRRPEIQSQTVFPRLAVVPAHQEGFHVVVPARAGRLRADVAVVARAAYAGPSCDGLRRQEARLPSSRCGVWDAFERRDPAPPIAADLA